MRIGDCSERNQAFMEHAADPPMCAGPTKCLGAAKVGPEASEDTSPQEKEAIAGWHILP
jgi:hypothetical protein